MHCCRCGTRISQNCGASQLVGNASDGRMQLPVLLTSRCGTIALQGA